MWADLRTSIVGTCWARGFDMIGLWRVCALMVVISLTVGCSRDAPIYNVDRHPVPQAAQALPMSQIKNAIMLAGADRGWTFEEVGLGKLVGTLLIRTHTAKVDIKFSRTEYSIGYKDSVNLRYSGSTIHRNYNKWIMNLEQDIERDLQRKGLEAR